MLISMDYFGLFRRIALNALIWVALSAIVVPLLDGDTTFLFLFALLFSINLVIVLAMKNLAPDFFSKSQFAEHDVPQKQGRDLFGPSPANIGFRLYPLPYPRVHDEELRAFAPEYIHMDITMGNTIIFAGNVGRSVLRQFGEAVNRVLEVSDLTRPPQNKAKKTAK